MRSRVARSLFWDDPDLGSLDASARLIFFGLWCLGDREGRLTDDPRLIRARLFPYRSHVSVEGVDEYLSTLEAAELIVRYEVDGTRYIAVRRFKAWTVAYEKEPDSVIPAPPKQGARQSLDRDSVKTKTNTKTRTEGKAPQPEPGPHCTACGSVGEPLEDGLCWPCQGTA